MRGCQHLVVDLRQCHFLYERDPRGRQMQEDKKLLFHANYVPDDDPWLHLRSILHHLHQPVHLYQM